MRKRLIFLLTPLLFCNLVLGQYSEPVLKTKLTDSGETDIAAVNSDGSLNVLLNSAAPTTGTLAAPGSVMRNTSGAGGVKVSIRGTFTGLTANFECAVDGTNYDSLAMTDLILLDGELYYTAFGAGTWEGDVAGCDKFRVSVTSIASGSVSIAINSASWSGVIPQIQSYVFTKTNIRDGAGTDIILGQTTMSASLPVTIASNQSALPVTSAASATNIAKAEDVLSANADVGIPAMATRKATPANVSGTDGDYEFLQMSAGRLWVSSLIDTALPAGNNNIGDVDVASSALPSGASTSANQVTELASLAAIDAGTAAALGQTTMSASVPVAIASNQSSIPVTIAGAGTALTANSPATNTVGVASASAVASNSSRKGLIIVNVSVNKVCLGIGATAVLNSGICLLPGGTWTMDAFSYATSAVNAIASAASSVISVQEFQ